jgi:hypothetical protein
MRSPHSPVVSAGAGIYAFLNDLGEAGLEVVRLHTGRFQWRWHQQQVQSIQTYPYLGDAVQDALGYRAQPWLYEVQSVG